MFIPSYQIDAIKQKINMFDVCEKYGIEVNKTGFALCPFHDDERPSMKVYPNNRGYHCYVCHAGGDVIDFVSKYFSIPFSESVKRIDEDFNLCLGIGNALTKEQENEHKRILYKKRKQAELRKKTETELNNSFYDALDWVRYLEWLKEKFAPKNEYEDFDACFEYALKNLTQAKEDLDIAETKLIMFARKNR